MNKFIRKIQRSIFSKLLFIIIISGILAIIFTAGLFKLFLGQFISPFGIMAAHHTNYIIQEIGVPPDILKAQEIAQNLSMRIRFESPDFQWTTDDKLLSFKDFERMTSRKNGKIITNFKDFKDGIYYISVNQDSWRYLFAFDLRKSKYYGGILAILLIIFLTLVFSAAHLSIRKILKPIKWLTEGVEQTGKGNLDHQVPLRKMDELGELSKSFNSMTHRIKEMIRSREQLLLDVSHELRSPLTRINVALEFVPEGKKKESIREDVLELEKMITEILETERLSSSYGKLHLKKANVTEIIKETLQDFHNDPPGIQLISVPENVILEMDIERIKTVLKNVLENSFKYSKPESHPVDISLDYEEKSVVIRIKDYGSGIPEEELPYIFEPFYRIDKSRSKQTGGYGLGMSLCKKIMEAHGGRIKIKSEFNIGTTVFLIFKK